MADPKDLKESLDELAARAEAIDLLERCRRVLYGMPSWDGRARELLVDLHAFLGPAPAEGGGGAVVTEEKLTGKGGDGEVEIFVYDPPLGSHAADLQSLRATQEALEKAEGKIRRALALFPESTDLDLYPSIVGRILEALNG